jgi:ATP-dependent exoDNAse (exonuclease V) alpha subunit
MFGQHLHPVGPAVSKSPCASPRHCCCSLAKALNDLRQDTLRLRVHALVVVDVAAVVGTTDLRELLAATTAAGVKTVLVGDAHQLNPASPGAVCSPNSMTRGRDTDTAYIDRRTDAMPTAASIRAYISRRVQVRNTYSSTQTGFRPAMPGGTAV